jgi:PiT family inorganic phosphate transporter
MELFLVMAVVALAFANGANANFKGVASLYGSGSASFDQSRLWAMVCTAAGCGAAMFLGSDMVKAFSGKGLIAEAWIGNPMFLTAVAAGAALSNLLATGLGFPVSTTHMLIGGLVGAGWVADASGLNGWRLWDAFVRPLLLSPLIAVILGGLVSLAGRVVRRLGVGERWRDVIHFASAGAVCFSRGLNDTPKMAGLLVGIPWLTGAFAESGILVAMAIGGMLGARRIAETLGHGITGMDAGEGLCANAATSALTLTASFHGLPVSTTHVSVGALLGIGIVGGKARWRTALPVFGAWVFTLPVAAVASATVMALLQRTFR